MEPENPQGNLGVLLDTEGEKEHGKSAQYTDAQFDNKIWALQAPWELGL